MGPKGLKQLGEGKDIKFALHAYQIAKNEVI